MSGLEAVADIALLTSETSTINQFARRLMDTCKYEVRQKFEADVQSWSEEKKHELIAQGIIPLFYRFREHAELLYKRGVIEDTQQQSANGNATQIRTRKANSPLYISNEDESSTIKCICGFSDSVGDTVLCEKCDTWQHIACYYTSAQHVPDVHDCRDCAPRYLDSRGAKRRQQNLRKSNRERYIQEHYQKRNHHYKRKRLSTSPESELAPIENNSDSDIDALLRTEKSQKKVLKSKHPLDNCLRCARFCDS
jgi:hypothetical protein